MYKFNPIKKINMHTAIDGSFWRWSRHISLPSSVGLIQRRESISPQQAG